MIKFLILSIVSLLYPLDKKINIVVLDLEGESLTSEERTALTNKLILELSKTELYNHRKVPHKGYTPRAWVSTDSRLRRTMLSG
jgi:hypothetical protein